MSATAIALGVGALVLLGRRGGGDVTASPTPASPTPASRDTSWIDSRQWVALNAPLKSVPGARTPALYRDVAAQFDVVGHPRYRKAADGRTWCNIYVWDVTLAMGVEIPHWFDEATGAPRAQGRGLEMNANGVYQWLSRQLYGWRRASLAETKAAAARGQPAVAAWLNPVSSASGHVAMILPSGGIAQAGAKNLFDGSLVSGFGAKVPDYFVND